MRQPPLPFADVPGPRAAPVDAPAPPPARRIAPQAFAPMFTRHPRARRYVLRVGGDGTIRVTIPRWGSRREAEAFAASQRPWIEKQLRKLEAEQMRPRPTPLAPEEARAWRARAARELPPRLLELAAAHGLVAARVSVRNQRWRWGSCSRSGHICLNWRLVRMPGWIRDYVIIHELMHLRRMDHSPKFWTLVAAACPAYQAAREWLRRYGDRVDDRDLPAAHGDEYHEGTKTRRHEGL